MLEAWSVLTFQSTGNFLLCFHPFLMKSFHRFQTLPPKRVQCATCRRMTTANITADLHRPINNAAAGKVGDGAQASRVAMATRASLVQGPGSSPCPVAPWTSIQKKHSEVSTEAPVSVILPYCSTLLNHLLFLYDPR